MNWNRIIQGAPLPPVGEKVEVKGDLILSYAVFHATWTGEEWVDDIGNRLGRDRVIAWREVGE